MMNIPLRILMIFPGIIDDLPPLLHASVCMLQQGAHVSIVCAGSSNNTKNYIKGFGVDYFSITANQYPQSLSGKLFLRIKFLLFLNKIIYQLKPNVIWLHGGHAMGYLPALVRNKDTILIAHAHELYDIMRLRKSQNRAIRLSDLFLVPEVNRGWMLKMSSHTTAPFIVVPNRLPDDIKLEEAATEYTTSVFTKNGGSVHCKRFIIYQGYFSPRRCLEELIHAFKSIDDATVGLILLGDSSDKRYLDKLIQHAKSDCRIIYISKIPPPGHLRITAGCHAGVMLYAPVSLNDVYCAPNKIFEYSAFGLSMIMPAYPGLVSINDCYDLGETCDPCSVESIASALLRVLKRDPLKSKASAKIFLDNSEKLFDVYGKVAEFLRFRIK